MYLLDTAKTTIHETDAYDRIKIVAKSDAVLIVGFQDCDHPAITLGKYADTDEAQAVLSELFYALSAGKTSFEMPDSRLFHGEKPIRDARTKRRGGS